MRGDAACIAFPEQPESVWDLPDPSGGDKAIGDSDILQDSWERTAQHPPPQPPAADAAANTVTDEDEDEWEDSHTEISMADGSDSQTSQSAKEGSTPLPPPQASSISPSKQTEDSAHQEKKHALVERGRQLTKSKQRAKQTSLDFEARA